MASRGPVRDGEIPLSQTICRRDGLLLQSPLPTNLAADQAEIVFAKRRRDNVIVGEVIIGRYRDETNPLSVFPGEKRPAARRDHDQRALATDIAVGGGLLPHRQARTGRAPILDHLRMRSRRAIEPFDQIADQGCEGVAHDASVRLPRRRRQYIAQRFAIWRRYGPPVAFLPASGS